MTCVCIKLPISLSFILYVVRGFDICMAIESHEAEEKFTLISVLLKIASSLVIIAQLSLPK